MTLYNCILKMKNGVEEKMSAKWKEKEKTKPWFISRILQVRYIFYRQTADQQLATIRPNLT